MIHWANLEHCAHKMCVVSDTLSQSWALHTQNHANTLTVSKTCRQESQEEKQQPHHLVATKLSLQILRITHRLQQTDRRTKENSKEIGKNEGGKRRYGRSDTKEGGGWGHKQDVFPEYTKLTYTSKCRNQMRCFCDPNDFILHSITNPVTRVCLRGS
jgi:hypothetical protein